MKFLDEAKIYVKAGHGGAGCASFRREAHVPRGGPDGGNGGDGGDIILQVDPGRHTLIDLKGKRHFRAEAGKAGRGKGMHGRRGREEVVRVPQGTIVREAETGRLLADLVQSNQQFVVAKGGQGGRGNLSFASSTHRAPRKAQPGLPGEEKKIQLELKLLADIGLVGRPNAGKSTLISKISAARPKVADYPFTTLQPQLGVVSASDFRSFTVADIPGLIEGAHQGSGMGIKFLKHIERTRGFIHLIDLLDPTQEDAWASFQNIERELNSFSSKFAKRPRCVVFSKVDAIQDPTLLKAAQNQFANHGMKTMAISALTGEGLQQLIQKMAEMVFHQE